MEIEDDMLTMDGYDEEEAIEFFSKGKK